ncbi:phage holin, lambda family [Pseudomonas sp. 3A(2025)]
MTPMPEKDPVFWAALLAWLATHQPQLYAAAMSTAVAVLRVAYGRGPARQMAFEGMLCGCLTLCLVPLLDWASLPQGMATFAGGALGFLGVERVRALANRWAERKINAS